MGASAILGSCRCADVHDKVESRGDDPASCSNSDPILKWDADGKDNLDNPDADTASASASVEDNLQSASVEASPRESSMQEASQQEEEQSVKEQREEVALESCQAIEQNAALLEQQSFSSKETASSKTDVESKSIDPLPQVQETAEAPNKELPDDSEEAKASSTQLQQRDDDQPEQRLSSNSLDFGKSESMVKTLSNASEGTDKASKMKNNKRFSVAVRRSVQGDSSTPPPPSLAKKKLVTSSKQLQKALKCLCRSYGLCCSLVWRAVDGLLVLDVESSYRGTASEYVEASRAFKLTPGQGINGRVWKTKANELIPDVNLLDISVFLRRNVSQLLNIRSAFSIFANDVVYEFVTTKLLSEIPFETVDISAINVKEYEVFEAARSEEVSKASKNNITPAELERLCEKYSLCCCIVWEMRGGRLMIDETACFAGCVPGFVEDSIKAMRGSKGLRGGKGLAGRVWVSRTDEHVKNVQKLGENVYSRLQSAEAHNIRSSFAIFHFDRVYEFNTGKEMFFSPFTKFRD